jgi:hypothetical protein
MQVGFLLEKAMKEKKDDVNSIFITKGNVKHYKVFKLNRQAETKKS